MGTNRNLLMLSRMPKTEYILPMKMNELHWRTAKKEEETNQFHCSQRMQQLYFWLPMLKYPRTNRRFLRCRIWGYLLQKSSTKFQVWEIMNRFMGWECIENLHTKMILDNVVVTADITSTIASDIFSILLQMFIKNPIPVNWYLCN